MAALRKTEPALIYGDWKLIDKDNNAVFAYTRTYQNKTILVMLNFKSEATKLNTEIDLSKAKVLIGNLDGTKADVSLRPYEAKVLEL
jgi:oligo-1,6-glucosidase